MNIRENVIDDSFPLQDGTTGLTSFNTTLAIDLGALAS
jgi:hypothetical protein